MLNGNGLARVFLAPGPGLNFLEGFLEKVFQLRSCVVGASLLLSGLTVGKVLLLANVIACEWGGGTRSKH